MSNKTMSITLARHYKPAQPELILTQEQKDRLAILSKRWAVVSKPTPEIGWYNEKDGGSVGVVVGTESNPEHMYIGIEPDGYAHT